jgi:hypothetical protein
MTDVFQTHGRFSWTELMTGDVAAARAFYGDVLGWSFEEMPMDGMTYCLIKVGDQNIGGVMTSPTPAAPPLWVSYVTVDDVDARAARVAGAGGTVLMPPSDIPGVGRSALIRDPQGAVIHLMTYAPSA